MKFFLKMKKKQLYYFFLLFTFLSCKKEDKKEQVLIKIDNETSVVVQDTLANVEKNILRNDLKDVVIHNEFRDSLNIKFSNLETDDKFVFELPEGNINNTTSSIKIYNSENILIYKKEFKTREIINGYAIDDRYYTNQEIEAYILNEAKLILSKDSFVDLEKDIGKGEILDQEKESFENYSVFTECKNEKRPLFVIGLAEEDITYIGYSSKKNKVFDIIYCC